MTEPSNAQEPRKRTGSCDRCMFWDRFSSWERYGQCRRHAAQVGRRPWPETIASDWCGEFEPR